MPASLDLLDVSVWIPLAARDHVHHVRALHYWQEDSRPQVAFCRVTALGFVRLLMNPHVMRHGVLQVSDAWRQYEAWRRLPDVAFIPEPAGTEQLLSGMCAAGGFGRSGLTDAYLAAFARSGGYRLVSFDSAFMRFPNLDFLHLQP